MTLRRVLIGVPLAAILMVAGGEQALAAEYRAGDRVTLAADETIADDLYVAAGTSVIEGTVEGDLTVAAGTVDVRGTVTGSVNVAGGAITVSGSVGGAVRSMGGDVTISGEVGRDIVLTGGNVEVASGASVGGDVAGAAGNVTIRGTVAGDVLAAVGQLTIEGSVAGQVDANVGQLRIGPGASVGGDVRYASEREADVDDAAQIGGSVERRDPEWAGWRTILPDNILTTFLGTLLGLLVLGWGLMFARPGWVVYPGATLQAHPLLAVGAGLAVWIGQFLLLILLGILAALAAQLATSFGGAFLIPMLIVLLAVVALIFLAQVYVAMAIGGVIARSGVSPSPWISYALGALVWAALLALLGWLTGLLGALVFLIGWVMGLGAVAVHQLSQRRRDLSGRSGRAQPAR